MRTCKKYVLAACLLNFLVLEILGQNMPIEIIHYSGPPTEVTNIVILGDGYTDVDQEKFILDATKAMQEKLNQEPWKSYRNKINVFAIKVVSKVRGASMDPNNLIDNYFGSSYWSYNIERLLMPWRNSKIVNVLMSNTPFFDIGVLVVNDDKYGGSGGTFAVFSTNQAATEIMIHELGHSFVNLADEYWAGSDYAREQANMTKDTKPGTIKWKNFLNKNGIGIYPHSESPTWHRPHQNCKMRFLGPSFCDVCSHEIKTKLQLLSTQPEPSIPIAFFGANKLEIKVNEKVNFIDLSSFDPISWEWTFEGGSPASSTDQNPEIIYKEGGIYQVSLKVKNEKGENMISRVGFIKVIPDGVDEVPPIVKVKNIEIELDSEGIAVVVPDSVDDGTFDNVGLDRLEISKSNFDCGDIGVNTVIFKAIDTSGNEASAEVEVTIVDNFPPEIVAYDIEIQLDRDGFATLTLEDVDKGTFDNCSIQSMTLSKTKFGLGDKGDNSVLLTVRDQSGNTSVLEIKVKVDIILSASDGENDFGTVKLYPNPAKELIQIEYVKTIDPLLQSIQVLDSQGRLINEWLDFEKSGKRISLDIGHLPSGQYFVRLDNGKKLTVLRFTLAK
ncbi:M64 family metallo-endopeptidase [Aquiflexum sp. TKW24L]|uniref:M64 family metallopeptidase n=1 Tax=Aquiflexum sp. TKW24L TaxID=2942212 RepID=UPI0020BFD5E6|nr:M64 family metallopeptidase [Aquiflexum sp. TKW24L]MCL6259300.1 M64 family metallo-endopeptidase [Aquiflexum sp. TKW24L]